ncbi:hypothetical protein RM553_12880 [Zunongwangia sp. F363]|uniref:Uncharacterized protein n=1 Tax=Autumnicola tepida TaxID=3075595 RepID=A0ABU3CBL9_9FLAO|nr:hypothetical protein [Zunongwangia sp. F363]MDT0643730.1 hypothetical protein [Zunongwangia sp. F363]
MKEIVSETLDIVRNNQAFFIGVVGLFITYHFSKLTRKRESDKMLKDLFEGFNQRYDLLNNKIYDIVKASKDNQAVANKSDLTADQKKTLIDYFNLCAEEYFGIKGIESMIKFGKAGKQEWTIGIVMTLLLKCGMKR